MLRLTALTLLLAGLGTVEPARPLAPAHTAGTLPSVLAIAVDPESVRTVYLGTYRGLRRTDDGGRHWRTLAFARRSVDAIAIDPQNPRTLYAAADGDLLRSTDGGAKWHKLRSPNPRVGADAVAVDPRRSDTLYAGTTYGCTHCDVSGVFKSTDGGRSWRDSQAYLESGAAAIAVDPRNPDRVYAAIGRSTNLSVSVDGGATWKDLHPPRQHLVNALAIDPVRTQTIYVGTASGVFKSDDRGLSWRPASAGLPKLRDVNALATDGRHAGVLYTSAGFASHVVYESADAGRSWKLLWVIRR